MLPLSATASIARAGRGAGRCATPSPARPRRASGCRRELCSNSSNKAKTSAVAPARSRQHVALAEAADLRALAHHGVAERDLLSPPMTTWSPRRTETMVVARKRSGLAITDWGSGETIPSAGSACEDCQAPDEPPAQCFPCRPDMYSQSSLWCFPMSCCRSHPAPDRNALRTAPPDAAEVALVTLRGSAGARAVPPGPTTMEHCSSKGPYRDGFPGWVVHHYDEEGALPDENLHATGALIAFKPTPSPRKPPSDPRERRSAGRRKN